MLLPHSWAAEIHSTGRSDKTMAKHIMYKTYSCDISGSHIGDHEEHHLLGYHAMPYGLEDA
jgi:hypothetical protein